MVWLVLFISSVLLILLLIPFNKWNQLWYAGLISIPILYAIDSTLIALGAFSYKYPNSLVGGLPILYLLSSFGGGMLLLNYYPQKSVLQFPYILIASFLFLLLEITVHLLGYMNYNNWSPFNSYFLDIFGFTIVIWLWNWISRIKNKQLH